MSSFSSRRENFLTTCSMVRKRSLSDPSFRGNFQFSAGTSNSSLRCHLDSKHKDEYLLLHLAKGWKNELASMKTTISIASLSNPGSEVQPRVPFSRRSLLDHLLDFIIADDQVGALRCCLYHADFFPSVDKRCRMCRVLQTSSSLMAGASGQQHPPANKSQRGYH